MKVSKNRKLASDSYSDYVVRVRDLNEFLTRTLKKDSNISHDEKLIASASMRALIQVFETHDEMSAIEIQDV